MRALSKLLVSLVVLTPLAQAAPPAPAANHPILGIWRLALPELRCVETYRFRGDGTTLVTSKEEISESEYRIPDKPSPKGFYKLEDRIVKDNGKQDCSGEIMEVGTQATNFLRFHPSGALFLMCSDETMEACIGPFERVEGEEA
ncbi:hypothetical protein [Massilia sp. Leaf139]|uniref:hypothetical protein n=1 Tax=Massilia sp. Leaf139 TaxID=1736272 RepID=UPI0006FF5D9C|nr:hypothetical protein [Massilia sp. Leaf139]KQQ96778.1 hypothetical protein ASF77_01925 [Massilia sp. Leaf139]